MLKSPLFATVGLAATAMVLAAGSGCGTSSRTESSAPSPSPAHDPALSGQFVERGEKAGLVHRNLSGDPAHHYIVEANGPGVCALDFDGDGFEDLYFVNGQTLTEPDASRSTLYRNRGDGSFEDVTARSGLGHDGWGFGCAVADYDQDGLPDLYVAAWGPDHLYHNLGGGRFEEVSSAAGIVDDLWGSSVAFADYDRDGFPDIYVANYLTFAHHEPWPDAGGREHEGLKEIFAGPLGLPAEPDRLYHNRGDGTFEDVSIRSGINRVPPQYALAVVFTDLDRDGWPDVFVANDSVPNYLFRNLGDGHFEEVAVARGVAFNGDGRPQASMGVAFGDVDGDGLDDLLVTNFSKETNTLYRSEGAGFVDVTYEAGIGTSSWLKLAWGTFFFDYDHDGHLDLFVANGHVYPQVAAAAGGLEYMQEDQLYHNDGTGKFTLVDAGDLSRRKLLSRGAIAVDVDRDGDLDVVVVQLHDRPSLYENQAAAGPWIEPLLEGRDCNRDALGAVAEIDLGGSRARRTVLAGQSYASCGPRRLHFGLGRASGARHLHVTWPCGRKESFPVEAGTFPTLVEGGGTPD